ncbi:hypothetical protein JCM8115_007061 [Rhodotorula mucilaginosa]
MAFLSKPTLLFLSFNALRLLSVVGLCLVFASEIVTINSDVKGMRAARTADEKRAIVPGETTRPSTTASIKLVKRAAFPPLSTSTPHSHSSSSPPTISALSHVGVDTHAAAETRSSPTTRFVKRVHHSIGPGSSSSPRQHGGLVLYRDGDGLLARDGVERPGNAGLEKRDPPATTPTTTGSSSPRPGPTASNAALGKDDDDETKASSSSPSSSCAYIGETSIPKGAGGALFSTLERIFASLILLLMLFSELCPPFPPLSKPARLVDRFWSSFFPPFSDSYGVGVLGAVEVFVSCQVLSHPTKGWIQISSWYLFIIGILNMLAGLAFGARLKVIRSLGGDSTTPSALRQLRLAGAGVDDKLRDAATTTTTGTGPSPRAAETLEYSQPFGGGSTRCLVTTVAASQGPSHALGLQKEEEMTKPRFFPFSNFTASSSTDKTEAKKNKPIKSKGTAGVSGTRSRNGPNGIIISAPIRPASEPEQVVSIPYNHPVSHPLAPPPPPPVYHRGE